MEKIKLFFFADNVLFTGLFECFVPTDSFNTSLEYA